MSIWTPVINKMLVGIPAQYIGSICSSCAQGIGTNILSFNFYPLCYAAVLLKFIYYAQE